MEKGILLFIVNADQSMLLDKSATFFLCSGKG